MSTTPTSPTPGNKPEGQSARLESLKYDFQQITWLAKLLVIIIAIEAVFAGLMAVFYASQETPMPEIGTGIKAVLWIELILLIGLVIWTERVFSKARNAGNQKQPASED